MTIKDAKEEIQNAVTAYLLKDERGEYMLPVEKQRPVFLIGPPGVGKTAIMEQIAAEISQERGKDIGLLSYSMTHHTRQSALGLPVIKEKEFDGVKYDISEYTMSEIIASVYELMEKTGVREGILFLDEINCVSETLAPVMLQFLQYKVFGKHRLPKGWIIVTAGNPPEYNNSVREFDIVTMDRLKRIDVREDFKCWKAYARNMQVHTSIISYLENRQHNFYKVESTVEGKRFVTARGWEDLSRMIMLYEKLNEQYKDKRNFAVDEKLISQYLQNKSVANEFANYYSLFSKYRTEYPIKEILAGKASDDIAERAKKAPIDEKLSVLWLIIDSIGGEIREVMEKVQVVTELMKPLKEFRIKLADTSILPSEHIQNIIDSANKNIEQRMTAGNLSKQALDLERNGIDILMEIRNKIKDMTDTGEIWDTVNKDFNSRVKNQKKKATEVKKRITNVFNFCEKAFSNNQLVLLVTDFTTNNYISLFISKYGCDEYYKYNKELLFHERHKQIIQEIEELKLD